jgi:hypothetical protein
MKLRTLLSQAEWRSRRLAPRAGATAPPLPAPLDTPAGGLALLEEQVRAVRGASGVDPLEKARLLGVLAGLGLKALQVHCLAERIEMQELVLKQRPGGDRQSRLPAWPSITTASLPRSASACSWRPPGAATPPSGAGWPTPVGGSRSRCRTTRPMRTPSTSWPC